MARGDNVIQRIIRLIFDKAAAARAQSQAEGTVTTMDRAFGKLKTAALKVGAAIVAAFAVERLIAFAGAAVRAAQESERAWAKTSVVLRNAGVAIGDYREQIELAANALQASTKFTDEEAVDAVGRMVAIHGDAAQALKDLKFAADLAVQSDRDLASASEAVARARQGNTRILKEFGFAVKDGAKGVEELERRLKGVSDLDDPFAKLTKSSGEFFESFGRFIINQPLVRSALEAMAAGIDKVTGAMNRFNASVTPEKITELSTQALAARIKEAERMVAALSLTGVGGQAFKDAFAQMEALHAEFAKRRDAAAAAKAERDRQERERQTELAKERDAAQAKEIAALSTLLDLGKLTIADRERALIIERNIADQLDRGVRSAIQRAELEQRLESIRRVTAAPPGALPGVSAGLARGPGFSGAPIARAVSDAAEIEATVTRNRIRRSEEDIRESLVNIENAAFAAAFAMEDGFRNAFEQLFTDFEDLGEFATNIFAAIALGGIASIQSLARAKVGEEIAYGISEIAKGIGASLLNPPLAATHFASAAKHGVAAAAWAALSGAAGAVGGAIAGGGGSAGAGGSTRATTNTFQGEQRPGEVHIHFDGPGFSALARSSRDFQAAVTIGKELGEQSLGPNVRTTLHYGGR